MALCFNCGDLKFGAFCPCPNCNAETSGDAQLDMTFSDHFYSEETLTDFGKVIKAIREVAPDSPTERYWSFLQYISTNHPSILGIRLKDELAAKVERILRSISLPDITLKPGRHGQAEAEEDT